MESKLLVGLLLIGCLAITQVNGLIPCTTSCQCRPNRCCISSAGALLTSSTNPNYSIQGYCRNPANYGYPCDPNCSKCQCPLGSSCFRNLCVNSLS